MTLPTRIKFRVIGSTGSEDGFGAQTLQDQSPSSKGWQSQRFCTYPQQITFQLQGRAVRLRKAQFVIHHYKIPTEVELFYGLPGRGPLHSVKDIFWRKVGNIYFENRQTNKCKIMKNVLLDAVAGFFRLKIHRNHVNPNNLYNQVCLIGFNLIGEDVSDNLQFDGDSPRIVQPITQSSSTTDSVESIINSYLPGGTNPTADPALAGSINRPDKLKCLADDLAFTLYQDPDIAEIIRLLELRKKTAIDKELYPHAKELSEAIIELQQYGSHIADLEVQKVRAVEREDFDTAGAKKAHKERLWGEAMERLKMRHIVSFDFNLRKRPLNPLQDDGPSTPLAISRRTVGLPSHGADAPSHYDSPRAGRMNSLVDFEQDRHAPAARVALGMAMPDFVLPAYPTDEVMAAISRPLDSSLPNLTERRSVVDISTIPPATRMSSRAAGHTGAMADGRAAGRVGDDFPTAVSQASRQAADTVYDDRPLPALSNKRNLAAEGNETAESAEEAEGNSTNAPDVLSAKREQQYVDAIEVFSKPVVEEILSKGFKHRKKGVDRAVEIMSDASNPITELHQPSTIQGAAQQVLQKCLPDTVFAIFQEAIKLLEYSLEAVKESKPYVSQLAVKAIPILITRLGDRNARISSVAKETLLRLSQTPPVKALNTVCVSAMHPLTKAPAKDQTDKHYKGQLDLLHDLVDLHGLKQGLTVADMMKIAGAGFQHKSGEVRDAATRLTIKLYRKFGKPVRAYLPPDTLDNRKKVYLKQLFTEFDAIDGKPTKKQLEMAAKAKAQAEEDAQLAQITKLKAEMAMLMAASRGEVPVEDVVGGGVQTVKKASPQKGPPIKLTPMDDVDESDKSLARKPPQRKAQPAAASQPSGIAAKQQAPASKTSVAPAHLRKIQRKSGVNATDCVFCGLSYNGVASEDLVEAHYCRQCPVLTTCADCELVVEVAGASRHWLKECQKGGGYKMCKRCEVAVPSSELADHMERGTCPKSTPGMACCPFCETAIHDNDKSWKLHLEQKCHRNPRLDRPDIPAPRPTQHAGYLSRPPNYIPVPGVSPRGGVQDSMERSPSRIPTLAARVQRNS